MKASKNTKKPPKKTKKFKSILDSPLAKANEEEYHKMARKTRFGASPFFIENEATDISAQAAKVAKPYVYQIENNAAIPQVARLFGYAKFIDEPNFGSDPGIKIAPRSTEFTYQEHLITSAIKPFAYDISRIICKNKNYKKILKNLFLTYNYRNINGRTFSDPIPVSTFYPEKKCKLKQQRI